MSANDAEPAPVIASIDPTSGNAPAFDVGSSESVTPRHTTRRQKLRMSSTASQTEAAPVKSEVFVFGAEKPLNDKKFRYNKTFYDPTGNVVFKTSDNVLFRVHDYYLKANR